MSYKGLQDLRPASGLSFSPLLPTFPSLFSQLVFPFPNEFVFRVQLIPNWERIEGKLNVCWQHMALLCSENCVAAELILWVRNLCSSTGSCSENDPMLGLRLSCCHFESLNNFILDLVIWTWCPTGQWRMYVSTGNSSGGTVHTQ